MDNALKKAKDAAKRYRSGIVIAADTVVLSGKKIIGKPKRAFVLVLRQAVIRSSLKQAWARTAAGR